MSSTSLTSLIAAGMGPELHWFPEDVPLSRLAAVLVGMANTHGGSVILGVAPRSGEILGLREPEVALDRVLQAVMLIDPPLVIALPMLTHESNVALLMIVIPSGLPHVYSLDGRFLGRDGAQTNPMLARRLRQLLIERGVAQFEAQALPGASLSDLDPDQINTYLAALNLPGAAAATDAYEETLLQRGCLRRDAGTVIPTVASLVLMGRAQQWLPNAMILAARFPGVAMSDQFVKQEIRGALPEQIHQAEAFVRDHLRSVVRLVGLIHQETPEYPLEAVRELLVNAVAHRDYSQQGDCIHLHIFADRLEIHSPGGLPGPVNLENLLDARFSRNAVIVQALADLAFVERLGYGLDRVVKVLKQNNLRPPKFEEIAGSFRVTLYAPVQTPAETTRAASLLEPYTRLNLNPRQQQALNYLALHQRITSGEYQELCPDVHAETLRRDLADLVTRGVLIKVGDKKATYYILK